MPTKGDRTTCEKRHDETTSSELTIELRNPVAAGALAWLLPGAGHLYQRRYFKAAIYGLSVWLLLSCGIWMGSFRAPAPGSEDKTALYFARNVYCSWRPGDRRLAFIPQACVGVMALPAIMQARARRDADGSFWSSAFAPPRLPSDAASRPNQPTANDIAARLHSWLDVGVIYTVTAGLLNLLAIFDAIAGPTVVREEEESEKKKKSKKDKKSGDDAAAA